MLSESIDTLVSVGCGSAASVEVANSPPRSPPATRAQLEPYVSSKTVWSCLWGQYSLGDYGLAAHLLPEVTPKAMTITASIPATSAASPQPVVSYRREFLVTEWSRTARDWPVRVVTVEHH